MKIHIMASVVAIWYNKVDNVEKAQIFRVNVISETISKMLKEYRKTNSEQIQ